MNFPFLEKHFIKKLKFLHVKLDIVGKKYYLVLFRNEYDLAG